MQLVFHIILFLISPIVGLVCSFKRFKSTIGQIVFVLFIIALNYCSKLREQDDIYRYIEIYNTLLRSDYIGNYGYFINTLYTFLKNQQVSAIYMYTVIAALYGNGMYLCLKSLLNYVGRNRLSILLLVSSLFYISPSDFSVFRFYTAGFYFINYLYRIEVYGLSKKLGISLIIPILIHPIFLFFVVPYLAYKKYAKNIKKFGRLALYTVVFHFINIRPFLQSIGYDYFANTRYLTDERSSELTATFSIGQHFYLPMLLILAYALFLQYKRFNSLDETNKRLLSLSFFSLIVMNVSSSIPDLYLRFLKINFWLCTFPVLYYYGQTKLYKYKKMAVYLLPAMFFLSYDFFFVISLNYFDLVRLITSTFPSMFYTCNTIINNI